MDGVNNWFCFVRFMKYGPIIIYHALLIFSGSLNCVILLPADVVLWLATKIPLPAEEVLCSQSEYQRMWEVVPSDEPHFKYIKFSSGCSLLVQIQDFGSEAKKQGSEDWIPLRISLGVEEGYNNWICLCFGFLKTYLETKWSSTLFVYVNYL